MNSYQKLKLENKTLKEDINKILSNDIEVITKYKFKKSLEDLSWYGSFVSSLGGDGLLQVISAPTKFKINQKNTVH